MPDAPRFLAQAFAANDNHRVRYIDHSGRDVGSEGYAAACARRDNRLAQGFEGSADWRDYAW